MGSAAGAGHETARADVHPLQNFVLEHEIQAERWKEGKQNRIRGSAILAMNDEVS